MRYLEGSEASEAQYFIDEAVKEALKSRCDKSNRGVVLVKDSAIIGRGSNNPPLAIQCIPDYCRQICSQYCVHAEQNALFDALKKGYDVAGSRMYHIKVKDGEVKDSKKPCCVECSKMVLASGIGEFVLKLEQGLCVYGAQEFHDLSLKSLFEKDA